MSRSLRIFISSAAALCVLVAAHITPTSSEILLHSNIKRYPFDDIRVASTLAHEMVHIQQFRRMGSGNFKCTYAQQYIECAGCQNERHPLEREALQFEAFAIRRLAESSAVPRAAEAAFTPRQRALNTSIAANAFLGDPPKKTEAKPRVKPGDPDPENIARDACTLNGRLSPKDAEHCLDDLAVIYQDLFETIDDDFSSGFPESIDTYLKVSRKDRMAACTILKATHRDPEIGQMRQGRCETRSRSAVYKIISYALKKYPQSTRR